MKDDLEKKMWIECDIRKDQTWVDKYYCALHDIHFRTDEEPQICPGMEMYMDGFREGYTTAYEEVMCENIPVELIVTFTQIIDVFHLQTYWRGKEIKGVDIKPNELTNIHSKSLIMEYYQTVSNIINEIEKTNRVRPCHMRAATEMAIDGLKDRILK